MTHKPRHEVIELLARNALTAMDGIGVEDVTAGEVLSAIYTMAKNATKVVLESSEGPEREHNQHVILEVVADLYDLVKPSAEQIN